MKKYVLLLSILMLNTIACKTSKKELAKKYISVLSLIKSQVAHVDTSLYSIMKITNIDSFSYDTSYIPREEFGKAASEFLAIPDLSNKKIANRYKEETMYDETLNRVIISYTPIYPQKEEIQKQELLITPNAETGDKVNNIIINKLINNRDSSLQKNMLWQVDKSFQIISILQKPGTPETVKTIRVIWNDDSEQ